VGHSNAHHASDAPVKNPDAVARAMFFGWLSLLACNLAFVGRAPVALDGWRRVLHVAYDAGHILGLAVLAWLLGQALSRLALRIGLLVFCVLAFVASYGLLGGDLESFLERTPDGWVPWRAVFAAGATIAVGASLQLGRLLASHRLCFLGVAVGVGVAIGNHLVLQLNYPGTHFILGWCAASLIGASLIETLSRVRRPRAERAVLVVSAVVAIISYSVVPGSVVRSALLTSSGAIAAPFVTRLWAGLEPSTAPIIGAADAEWFRPRSDLASIPPEALPGAPREPTVVLLTIDGLRSDVVYGPAHEKAVPNLRDMAKRSLWFSRVWSPAAYTMASMHSFFTGTYRSQLDRARKNEQHLVTLLDRAGVRTLNVSTTKVLGSGGSIARGFAEERKLEGASSERVVDEVIEVLDTRAGGPLFIFSHIMDAHAPYTLGGKRGSQKQRYVAEVAFVDKAIGRLRRELAKRKLQDSTYLILSSDHGEAFGEHGRDFHATTVYEEMIRIPLLIEGPGIKPHHASTWVSLIDVGPTVLSLFGIPTPGESLGQSLVPFMRGERPRLTRPLAVDGVKIRALLIDERWKAIVDVPRRTEELYDLKSDPGEKQNLAEEPYAHAYFATLRAFFAQLEPRRKERRTTSH
jgi:hypothetical protein